MLVLSYLPDLRPRGIKAEAGLESSQWRGESGRIMTASGGVQGKVSDVQECAGCNKKIHDKFVLKVSLGWMLEYNYSGASLLNYCRPWTSTGTRTA